CTWRRASGVRPRSSLGDPSPRPRLHEADAAGLGLLLLDPGGARGLLRPWRRGDAEPHDEVEVEPDQGDDRARNHQHVDRIEAGESVGTDLGPAPYDLREERPDDRARSVDVDADDRRPVRGLIPGD